jgi:hypothetical protein
LGFFYNLNGLISDKSFDIINYNKSGKNFIENEIKQKIFYIKFTLLDGIFYLMKFYCFYFNEIYEESLQYYDKIMENFKSYNDTFYIIIFKFFYFSTLCFITDEKIKKINTNEKKKKKLIFNEEINNLILKIKSFKEYFKE